MTSPSAQPSPGPSPAQVAKAALLHLTQSRLEPTPDHYRQAYAQEWLRLGGSPAEAVSAEPTSVGKNAGSKAAPPTAPPDTGPAWADLIGRLSKGLERHHRQWTHVRKKDSLQRVLEGSRHSGERLLERLTQLVKAWDRDEPDAPVNEGEIAPTASAAPPAAPPDTPPVPPSPVAPPDAPPTTETPPAHPHVLRLATTLEHALLHDEPTAREARDSLQRALTRLQAPAGADAGSAEDARGGAEALEQACVQAQRVIEQRQRLVAQLIGLCQTLTDSLIDVAEDDSWVQGQCAVMRLEFDEGLGLRGAKRVQDLLAQTRERQAVLRHERRAAREAIKQLVHQMLLEIAELGNTTDRFQTNLVRYADTIEQADSLSSLAGLVREMVQDSRSVQGVIQQAQARLSHEHERASHLSDRVQQLEAEIRQLSSEVSTDPLTQLSNRRGLMMSFEVERSRVHREQGGMLCIGLVDVDNFKKLNDTLGHQTGDEALKFLARRMSDGLRPSDSVARYGGEEFVVLLPDTPLEEGRLVLTRLQRQLSAEFFTQDEHKVFITFSAGVTPYRPGETLEAALDRADMALYEAKRTGKNRTCLS